MKPIIRPPGLPKDARPIPSRPGYWKSFDGVHHCRDRIAVLVSFEGELTVNGRKMSTREFTGVNKLTEDNVKYIKGQLAAGAMASWLADKFGVTRASITFIKQKTTWAHVDTPKMELEGPTRKSR